MGLGHVCAHSEGTLMAVLRARVSVRAGPCTLHGQRAERQAARQPAQLRAAYVPCSIWVPQLCCLPCLPSLHAHSSSHVHCSNHTGFRNGSKWGPMPGAELCTAPPASNRRPSDQGLRATLRVCSPKEKMSRVTGAVHAQLHSL